MKTVKRYEMPRALARRILNQFGAKVSAEAIDEFRRIVAKISVEFAWEATAIVKSHRRIIIQKEDIKLGKKRVLKYGS